MTMYKLTYGMETTHGVVSVERWFSARKDAVAWADEYLALGYFPNTIEKFKRDGDYINGKTTYFPLIAIKHFFKGGMF